MPTQNSLLLVNIAKIFLKRGVRFVSSLQICIPNFVMICKDFTKTLLKRDFRKIEFKNLRLKKLKKPDLHINEISRIIIA